jgi:pimeloyl-ACP methyl ester carboxylesterase
MKLPGLLHRTARLLMIGCGVALFASQCLAETEVREVREERLMLPVRVAPDKVELLEAFVVRPVGDGKFPVALIVNGSAAKAERPDMHADWLSHLAHDFAHRGWLAASVVWRGYGDSTGAVQDEAGTCAAPEVARFFNAHANDLGQVLNALHSRPDADPATTLGVGISIGGASMLDLAARADHPLTAVVNISGGIYHYNTPGVPASSCDRFNADLVRTMNGFGKTSRVPTLWLYAQNDPYFGPKLMERMLAAYRSGGGMADSVLLPPFEADGHTLFRWQASALTRPEIDRFLRSNRLPAGDRVDLTVFLKGLPPESRQQAALYFHGVPNEKAMAMSAEGGDIYWAHDPHSLDKARDAALSFCRQKTGQSCRISAQNDRLIGF